MLKKSCISIKLIVVLSLLSIMITDTTQKNIEKKIKKHKLNQNQTALLIKETTTVGINRLSTCKVELDDGKIIDLTSLDNAANPR